MQPFKLMMLKIASQEATKLLASGDELDLEAALPVALDAVERAQEIFKPSPAIERFPHYLLAARANLALRRARECEDFLSLASWLVLKRPDDATHEMRGDLARMFGQLRSAQGEGEEALRRFAEDVYWRAEAHGPEDPRTTSGYYALSRQFAKNGDDARALSCTTPIVDAWYDACVSGAFFFALVPIRARRRGERRSLRTFAGVSLRPGSLAFNPDTPRRLSTPLLTPFNSTPTFARMERTSAVLGAKLSEALRVVRTPPSKTLPFHRAGLLEMIDMLEDVLETRRAALGDRDPSLGDCRVAAGLALVKAGGAEATARARLHFEEARVEYDEGERERLGILRRAVELVGEYRSPTK